MSNISPTRNYTTRAEIDAALSVLRQTFGTGCTKTLAWRKWQLKQCWWMVEDHEKEICQALAADLNRHEFESYASDILGLKTDIMEHIEHLEEWTQEEKPKAGVIMGTLGKARIRKEPLGVTLIIGAWNFPFLLLLQPLVAAIAAGCVVLLKPSELAQESERLLCKLVPQYLDSSTYKIVTGGPKETGYILQQKYDHIFFTGSASVARHIALAAAKNLTPTVLELGGQGPAIVTKSANIDLAAKRICYAKFLNAGQICLSVNHVFVHPEVHEHFVSRLIHWNNKFSGSKGKGSQMGHIVNERNYDRLHGILEKSHGKIVCGGSGDRATLAFEPTVVDNVSLEDPLLSQELFGPILPVLEADYEEATRVIASMPHPLAIYIFSTNQAEIDYVLDHSLSGGVTVNDVLMHAGVPNAPFGGVGESGYGSYHGRYGLDSFSYFRTVVAPPMWLDKVMSFRYPPFDIKHKSKIAVKNKIGFRRGEGLKDQVIRKPGGRTPWLSIVLAMLAVGWLLRLQQLEQHLRVSEMWGTFRKAVLKR